jgi:hypothetical protein
LYDGKTQKPIFKHFLLRNLMFQSSQFQKRTTFTFSINDSSVGSVFDPGIFAKGTMFFGFDAEGGDWSMSKLSLEKLNNGDFSIVDTSTTKVTKHNDQGLQAIA